MTRWDTDELGQERGKAATSIPKMRTSTGSSDDSDTDDRERSRMRKTNEDDGSSDEGDGEAGEADFEPLLESHELDPDKIKDVLEEELADPSLTTTYDRK